MIKSSPSFSFPTLLNLYLHTLFTLPLPHVGSINPIALLTRVGSGYASTQNPSWDFRLSRGRSWNRRTGFGFKTFRKLFNSGWSPRSRRERFRSESWIPWVVLLRSRAYSFPFFFTIPGSNRRRKWMNSIDLWNLPISNFFWSSSCSFHSDSWLFWKRHCYGEWPGEVRVWQGVGQDRQGQDEVGEARLKWWQLEESILKWFFFPLL